MAEVGLLDPLAGDWSGGRLEKEAEAQAGISSPDENIISPTFLVQS